MTGNEQVIVQLIEHLLCVRNCSKHFTCSNLVSFHNFKEGTIIISVLEMRKPSTQRLDNLLLQWQTWELNQTLGLKPGALTPTVPPLRIGSKAR